MKPYRGLKRMGDNLNMPRYIGRTLVDMDVTQHHLSDMKKELFLT